MDNTFRQDTKSSSGVGLFLRGVFKKRIKISCNLFVFTVVVEFKEDEAILKFQTNFLGSWLAWILLIEKYY